VSGGIALTGAFPVYTYRGADDAQRRVLECTRGWDFLKALQREITKPRPAGSQVCRADLLEHPSQNMTRVPMLYVSCPLLTKTVATATTHESYEATIWVEENDIPTDAFAVFGLGRIYRWVRIPVDVSADSGDLSTGYEAVGAKRR
jgi:hypothetical protein